MSAVEHIEHIDEEVADEASDLAGCISELVANWIKNNDCDNPWVVLTAFGLMIAGTARAASCPHCRHSAVVSVIDAIIAQSDVLPEQVLRDVSLMQTEGKKFDA